MLVTNRAKRKVSFFKQICHRQVAAQHRIYVRRVSLTWYFEQRYLSCFYQLKKYLFSCVQRNVCFLNLYQLYLFGTRYMIFSLDWFNIAFLGNLDFLVRNQAQINIINYLCKLSKSIFNCLYHVLINGKFISITYLNMF